MLTLRSLLIFLLTTAALLVAATGASAHLFCVGVGNHGCTGPVRPATETGLAQAFSDAAADNDSIAVVSFGASNPILVDTPISVAASHPIIFQGVHDSGIDANIEWLGSSGTFLTIDNSAAGKRGYVSQVNFWTTGDSTALRVKSTDVVWSNFSFGSSPAGSTPTAVVADSSNVSGGRFDLGTDPRAARGISVVGPNVDVDWVRFEGQGASNEGIVQVDPSPHKYTKLRFSGVANPLRVERGTMSVTNSLVQLGVTAGATAGAASTTSPAGEAAVLKLGSVTVLGGGQDQTALRAESNDSGKPAQAWADSTLIDLRGSGALFASCSLGPGGVGTAGIDAKYSLFAAAASARDLDPGCDSGAVDGPTNIDSASHPPIYSGNARQYEPAENSPAIDAGNPAPDLVSASSGDIDGYARICSVVGLTRRMDIGAYENATACPIPSWSRPDFGDDDPAVPHLGHATGTFRRAAHPRGLRVVKKRPKGPHFKVRTENRTDVDFTLVDKRGGYKVRGKCAGRPSRGGARKRCDRVLNGRTSLTFPAGTSYLVFGGLWNHKRLATGHYRLRGTLSDDSTFAVGLNFRR